MQRFSTHAVILYATICIFALIFLSSCFDRPNKLQRIKKSGELKVLIRNIPGVYYEGPFDPVGFDYELSKEFAKYLGVKLVLITKHNISSMFEALKNHQADMATGRIIQTAPKKKQFSFSQPYQHLEQILVYRSDTKRIKSIKQIDKQIIEVVKNSSQEELLELVHEKVIDFTIANSHELIINQRFYPELRSGIMLAQEQPISWAFTQIDDDQSLVDSANKFLSHYKNTHKLTILTERYYGHIDKFNYVDARIFQRHIVTRLPKFRAWFEKAGKDHNIDWNLLAAISYQESHWKTDAVSPTGVKGLMMLTQATAKYIGISNRLSPYQSIFGGSAYYAKLIKRLPPEIKQPDSYWFALAAYNMGYGHLYDAMKLSKKRGLNNTKWANLKQVIPLLQRSKWHKQTRYGYARGRETTHYIKNIRKYYDILKWKSEEEKQQKIKLKAIEIKTPAL